MLLAAYLSKSSFLLIEPTGHFFEGPAFYCLQVYVPAVLEFSFQPHLSLTKAHSSFKSQPICPCPRKDLLTPNWTGPLPFENLAWFIVSAQ